MVQVPETLSHFNGSGIHFEDSRKLDQVLYNWAISVKKLSIKNVLQTFYLVILPSITQNMIDVHE